MKPGQCAKNAEIKFPVFAKG